MSRHYEVMLPDGVRYGVDVDKFRKSTTKYLEDRLDGLVTIKMRCYRDGRWDINVRTFWFPNTLQYNKRWRVYWTSPDIKQILDEIIGDYCDWTLEVDESVNRLTARWEESKND